MSLSDPIADMLLRVQNALAIGESSVALPHSRIKGKILAVLQQEGFVAGVRVAGEGVAKRLEVDLKYVGHKVPAIRGLRRISKPGLRRYVGHAELPRVLGGMGIALVSTSAGIMTDRQARQQKLGGEVLCYVW